jgi:CheY-like chemotaxis protein
MLSFFFKKWQQTQVWLKTRRDVLFSTKVLNPTVCTVLCVDDDHSFCLFMQKLADSLGIRLDIAYSVQEAQEAIEKKSDYQAFIIDGHLPEESGFVLVAWIREKKKLTVPIGFISRIYRDAASFRLLKEQLQVNYILEKPLAPSEAYQLLVQLCPSQLAVGKEPFLDALLADLKMSYQRTIFDKIERLEKMILNVQKDPSIENLQILKEEVHKIAGSAGMHGYIVVSDLCKNLELDLIKQIDLVKRGEFDLKWLSLLDDFFAQLKFNFQM